jgi:hypothetical protein
MRALLTLLLLSAATSVFAAGPSRETVQVASVSIGSTYQGYRIFSVHTYGDDHWGGTLAVLVPQAQANSFAARYGTEIRWQRGFEGIRVATKRLDGYVFRLEDQPWLCLDPPPAPFGKTPAVETSSGTIRTWTSADGRTVEAEFLSATSTHVTIRRTSDGQVFTFELAKLSQADRDFVEAKR